MRFVKINLDFSRVKNIDDFYENISTSFGFPDFFGKNVDALIDCLFYLRFQDNGMNFHLEKDEYALLNLLGFSSAPQQIKDTLIFAVEFVNMKCNETHQEPSIILLPDKKQ